MRWLDLPIVRKERVNLCPFFWCALASLTIIPLLIGAFISLVYVFGLPVIMLRGLLAISTDVRSGDDVPGMRAAYDWARRHGLPEGYWYDRDIRRQEAKRTRAEQWHRDQEERRRTGRRPKRNPVLRPLVVAWFKTFKSKVCPILEIR
jgi:hypothetical protein